MTEHDAKGLEIIAGWLQRDGLIEPAAMLRRLAASAIEGQAEPVAWMTEGKYPSPRFIIGDTDPSGVWKEQYVPLYLHPSAELTALRERIAGMEKDAEKRRDALIEALAEVAVEYVADRHLGHYSRQWEAVVAKEKQSD